MSYFAVSTICQRFFFSSLKKQPFMKFSILSLSWAKHFYVKNQGFQDISWLHILWIFSKPYWLCVCSLKTNLDNFFEFFHFSSIPIFRTSTFTNTNTYILYLFVRFTKKRVKGGKGSTTLALTPTQDSVALYQCIGSSTPLIHRRRIKTEEKAIMVVAAAWEAELSPFLAVLAILHQDDLKNMINCTRTI